MRTNDRSGRSLVATERALYATSRLSPLNLVVLVRLDGPVVPEAREASVVPEAREASVVPEAREASTVDGRLPAVLTALQQRHPLLRARIIGPPARPRFEVGDPGPIPLRILPDEDALAVVEAEMNTPFDPAVGPLARLTYVSGCLILTLHHAIADGTSTANLVHELLGRLAAEDQQPTVATPFPPPLNELLPRAVRRRTLALAAAEGIGQLRSRGGRPVPPAGRAVTRTADLGSEDTAALVDRCRRQRLTMTSVLTAGLLWQANAALYSGRPVMMHAVIWTDLRPQLAPAPSPGTLGCYISMLRFGVRVDPARGFGALTADVQAKIRRAAGRRDGLPAALLSPAMTRLAVRWPVSRLGTVALSYAPGSVIRPSYGPLAVREVRAFVSNNRIGADVAAACGVHQGALWCDLLYLDSDYDQATATALADGLMCTLRDQP